MSTEPSSPDTPKRKRGPRGGMNASGKNQWTKIQAAKAAGIESAEQAEDEWRLRLKAAPIMHRLHLAARGLVKLTGSEIKAAEVYLDRVEPRLSAVEQTQVNPDDLKPPLELLRELAPLLRAHPEWLRELGFIPAPLGIAPVDTHTAPALDEHTAVPRDKADAA